MTYIHLGTQTPRQVEEPSAPVHLMMSSGGPGLSSGNPAASDRWCSHPEGFVFICIYFYVFVFIFELFTFIYIYLHLFIFILFVIFLCFVVIFFLQLN